MDPFKRVHNAYARYQMLYRTYTGVTCQDEDFIVVPVNSLYGQNAPLAPPVVVATEPASFALNLEGAGQKSADLSAAISDKDNTSEKLTPAEIKALKTNIEATEQKATQRQLQVQSFETGKRKVDQEVEQALNEQGYGKRRKTSLAKHSLTFI